MLQDNLARNIPPSVPELKLHVNEKMGPGHKQSPVGNIIDFSKINENEGLPEDVILIRKKIDAWLDLRISIELDKIFNKLMVSKFKKMIEETKKRYNDPRISEELDKYTSKMIEETKKEVSLVPELSDIVKVVPETPDTANTNYQQATEGKGSQKKLSNGHFNSNGNNTNGTNGT